MPTAWGYVRCSTDMQDHSIEDQKAEILRYAREHGFVFIKPYWFVDEGKSGISIEEREGFQSMIAAVEQRLYELPDAILVYDVSRWGRYIDPDEAAYWEYTLKRHGIQVIYTHEDFPNDTSIGSAALKAIKRSTAVDYVRRLSLTTTRGSKTAARQGYWNGSIAPYGYKRLLVDEHGNPIKVLKNGERKYQKNHKVKLIPGNPKEIEVVKRIFHCYAYKGMGVKAIVNMLNSEGIPSPKGGKWCITIVYRILTNPVYTGAIVWGKTKRGKFSRLENTWGDINPTKTLHDRDKWVICENAHEPIISKELFQRVEKIRKQRDCFTPGHGGRTYGSPYLLTGLIYCSRCGFKMKGRTLRYSKQGKAYQYYEDGGFHRKGKEVCTNIYIPREFLDSFALERIATRLQHPEWIKHIETELRRRLKESSQDEQIQAIEQELKEVEAKIDRLLDLAESSQSPKIRERLAQREQERRELKKKLEQLKQSQIDPTDIDKVVQELIKTCEDWKEVLARGTVEEKKQIVRNFIKEIIVDRDTNNINFFFYKSPFFDVSDTCRSARRQIQRTDKREKRGKLPRYKKEGSRCPSDPEREV